MRRTFLIWLSAVICTTFLITGTLVYSQFAHHARERAEQMMSTRLNDILELFLHAERSVSYLSRANDASALDRTRALAEILYLNPELLKNQEELQGICNRLGAEQIAISTADGTVEAAVPQSFVGYKLENGDDIRLVMAAEGADGFELCGDLPTSDTANQSALQFAGVRRIDKPGMVRLGFRTRYEQSSREENSIDLSTSKLRLDGEGQVIVFRRGMRLSGGRLGIAQTDLLALKPDKLQEITMDNKEYFLYAVESGGYRLVGILAAKDIYRSSRSTILIVLLSNFLLFIAMFAVVSYLLQRIVLRNMSKVNETLREITEGDLEKRVDVGDSPEFARLSNGINFMVDSLRSVGEERQQGIKRGLDLARTLQTTVLQNKFPAFPHINSFDLYAACLQASEVGGDFYDFSMPDEKHLHFLVADVDASGVPAALFMMRAMSILRTLTRSGESPVNIVANANRELCDDSQAGIRMALFYGSLDINTGELAYVNAGRLCVLKQSQGGRYEPLGGTMGEVLGEQANATYHTSYTVLEPDDRLFLYTEGVMRVTNTNNMPFNEKKLRAVLNEDTSTVTELVQKVRSSLRQHAQSERFSRDITMLSLEFKGQAHNKAVIDLTAQESDIAEDLIATQMEELFAAPLDIADVQNSISAILAALPPDTELNMELRCTEQLAEVRLTYAEPPFNPLEQMPHLPVDQATFEYNKDQKVNKLTIWKNLT